MCVCVWVNGCGGGSRAVRVCVSIESALCAEFACRNMHCSENSTPPVVGALFVLPAKLLYYYMYTSSRLMKTPPRFYWYVSLNLFIFHAEFCAQDFGAPYSNWHIGIHTYSQRSFSFVVCYPYSIWSWLSVMKFCVTNGFTRMYWHNCGMVVMLWSKFSLWD